MADKDRWGRFQTRLETVATVLLILLVVGVGALIVSDRIRPGPSTSGVPAPRGPEPVPPAEPIEIGSGPSLGNRAAAMAIVLFSDFECPYCARVAKEVLPGLRREFIDTGRAQLIWRHYPLPIHENARNTAIAAECADQQGQFWEFHDWAFENQATLSDPNLTAAAAGLGVDVPAFTACLGGRAKEVVDADFEEALRLKIGGTPTWLIGYVESDGRLRVLKRIDGARPFDALRVDIESLVTAHGSN